MDAALCLTCLPNALHSSVLSTARPRVANSLSSWVLIPRERPVFVQPLAPLGSEPVRSLQPGPGALSRRASGSFTVTMARNGLARGRESAGKSESPSEMSSRNHHMLPWSRSKPTPQPKLYPKARITLLLQPQRCPRRALTEAKPASHQLEKQA